MISQQSRYLFIVLEKHRSSKFKIIFLCYLIKFIDIDELRAIINPLYLFTQVFLICMIVSKQNQKVVEAEQDRQMFGRFQINPLIYVYVPILFFTPLYTYHMAVSHDQQKPFPNATVTATACHYPQDIVFRYTMLIASSIVSLTFYIIFRWLQNQCQRIKYRRLSKWYFYVTQFSMICYSITIGTIDQKGTGDLHGPCAVIFFVVWMVIIVRMTLFIRQMRQWDTTVISQKSMWLKNVLVFYITGVWIYCAYYLIILSDQDKLSGKSDKYVVILEWNSVLINLLWVLTFVLEWKYFNFCLDFYPKKEEQLYKNQDIISRNQKFDLRNQKFIDTEWIEE